MSIVPIPPRRTRSKVLAGLLVWWVVIGPWPARNAPPRVAGVRPSAVGEAGVSRGNREAAPIRIGLATVDLVPPRPVALAGHIGGIAEPFAAVNSRCMAKALTVTGPGSRVTILTVDLLLINARLARAILDRTGLPRDQIYFTATHTHGAPGGWGAHPLERLAAGTYDPAEFDRLASRLGDVVLRSRAVSTPAEVAFVRVAVPGMQWNRVVPDGPTNDDLSAWIFRAPAPLPGRPGERPPLATLAVFGAHATVAHPDPPRLGADYPGAFAAELARIAGGEILFAAGTVGDAGPVRPEAANEQLRAMAYGHQLAARLAPAIETARTSAEVVFANHGEEVDLPPIQVPFRVASLRFSPLATWWVGRPRAYMHAVRLGPGVLVGFPGDYAGELSRTIRADLPVVATSFSGDYKGYLETAATFRARACYETRWMSFFGPHLGEHLTRAAEGLIGRLVAPPR